MKKFDIISSYLQPGTYSVWYVDEHGTHISPLLVESTIEECVKAIEREQDPENYSTL